MKHSGKCGMCEGGGLVHDPMEGHVSRCIVGEEVRLVHDPGGGCFKCTVGALGVKRTGWCIIQIQVYG